MKKIDYISGKLSTIFYLILVGLILVSLASCTKSEGRDAGSTIWGNTRSTNDPGLGNGLISFDEVNIYAITTGDGYFSVSGIPDGNYNVSLAKFGYRIYSGTASVTRGLMIDDSPVQDRPVSTQILFEFPVGLPGDGVLNATVLNENDEPVEGAEVDLIYTFDGSFHVTSTDNAGSFYFKDLLLYPDYLFIDADGYKPAIFGIDDIITFMDNGVDGALVNLIPLLKDEPEEGDPSGSVSGVIKDETDIPLTGIKVALYEFDEETDPLYTIPRIVETDEQGAYSFMNIPVGEYVVWAGHSNYFPVRLGVEIEDAVMKTVNIVLSDATNAEVHPLIKESLTP